ncbi:polysaccharide biosynthesis tyrosine autokinase [Hyphomonas sp. WL0036]|uniref:GumC family protein n=1 Tax=Hyphomonas sediminis TaxID=2866160 RepID=UPI001C7F3CDB|nr:polysaccharide biosynthesis tyrosine autokinase [Hyphomonas sediminis]MBY9067954.1 polysaccharide biosynthesis tyrosine autokinase [Hyphomonas sediminis]
MTKSYMIEIPSSSGHGSNSDGSDVNLFDIKVLLGIVYRRFWLILTGFVTVFGLVAFYTFTQTPTYKAQAVIQLDTNQINVIDLGALFSGAGGATTSVIDTEVRVIGSKTLLRRVAEKQRLIEDPEFNWTLRPKKDSFASSVKKSVVGMLGGDTSDKDPFAGFTPEQKEAEVFESVVGTLASKVQVGRIGATYLLTVDVSSPSPETAARLANEVAEQYRVQQLEKKYEATRKATEWLQERVAGLREEVEDKEQRVEAFRAETGLLEAQGTTLTEQQIGYLTSQRGQAQIELDRARARYESMRRQIDSGAGVEGVSEVINSNLINDLKTRRSEILRRVAELETRLGERHPDIISARNEVADIDRQLNAEMNRIAANLESEVRVAQSQYNSIQNEIGRSTSQLRGNNINLVRLRELERDSETSRVMLEEFLARSKQTREQDALITADSSILSTASVPSSPAAPRKFFNLLLGCILGAIIGGGLAILAEFFDSHLSSSDDIENKLGSNPIGSVPLIRTAGILGIGQTNPADFLVENPLSAYAESIRYLRAAIAFSDLDSETKTVAITSSLPDEGKTSLALSLGRMSAMSGSRTLVIDGDFRRRQLTEMAGLKPEIGFVEHLFGAGQLSDAIVKDHKTMLDILPLSLNGHTPHDVFGTRAFDELLARLRSMYDLILVDTGPLLLMAEARVVAGKMDKCILVVRWRQTTRSAARQSLALLRNFKADLLGVTLNMVDLNRRRHHRDPGATYKAYRKYYQMEAKRSLFGWGRASKKASNKGPKSSIALQVPPSKASSRGDQTDRISAE